MPFHDSNELWQHASSLVAAVRSGPGESGPGGREQTHTQVIEVSLEIIFYCETSDSGGVALLL